MYRILTIAMCVTHRLLRVPYNYIYIFYIRNQYHYSPKIKFEMKLLASKQPHRLDLESTMGI